VRSSPKVGGPMKLITELPCRRSAHHRSTGGWLGSRLLEPIPAGLNCRISNEGEAASIRLPLAHPGPGRCCCRRALKGGRGPGPGLSIASVQAASIRMARARQF